MTRSHLRLGLAAGACLVAVATVGSCVTTGTRPSELELAASRQLERVRSDPEQLASFLEDLPLGGDLHHHLGGAIPPQDLVGMAAADGLCLPRAEEAVWALERPQGEGCPEGTRPVADALAEPELRDEIERRWSMEDYLSNGPSVDRRQANDHFFALFARIDPALDDLARNLVVVRNDAARQGALYLETSTGPRGGPELFAALDRLEWRDDVEAMRRDLLASPQFQAARTRSLAALESGLRESERQLGCGGPEAQAGCDVTVRLQLIALRTFEPKSVFGMTLLAYEAASALPEIVGVNLVAPEHDPVSVRDYDLHMGFHAALGPLYPEVGRSLHAAELTDEQARELGATDHLERVIAPARDGGAAAQRVGHGVSLDAEERRDEILNRMASEKIAVELNLRSNEELLGVRGSEHPLPDYLAAGVPIVLSTDDPGLMLTTLRDQFRLALQFSEVGYLELKRFATDSIRYSFLDDADKRRLLDRLAADYAEFEKRFAR